MSPHLRYARTVLSHKWFVFLAGLKTGAPLWRLVVHDWTKFTPAEWGAYVRRFGSGQAGQTDKSLDGDDFHRAWTHHWHRNAHHWEHWLKDDGTPMPMPEKYVREMVADWLGAGRSYTGSWDMREWFVKNQYRIRLHPETWPLVFHLLYEELTALRQERS